MAAGPAPGAEEAAIAVPDAILAIRTFPRRYREALGRIPADRLRVRPESQTRSALEHAVDAGDVLGRLARGLPRALDEPGVRLPPFDADDAARETPAAALDPAAAVAAITAACETLTTRAERASWEAWERRFTVGEEEHPAAWIVQHAAVEGSHHLREIERVGRLLGVRDEED